MFQILTFIEARLTNITPRTEKHGDDNKTAITLSLEIETANTLLDTIDPKLRHALYVATEGQEQLPGIEPSTPVLRANAIDRVNLVTKHEGWTLEMDDGIDNTTPMVFGGVKVDKLSVEPKQGGSVVLRLRVGTSDISADKLGKIGMHLAQSVWIIIRPPTAPADAIDGSVDAFKKDHPGFDMFNTTVGTEREAGDVFAERHGSETGDGASEADDIGSGTDDSGPGAGESDNVGGDSDGGDADITRSGGGAWPDEAAELEAGMSASMAAAGLAPKAARRARRAAAGAVE